MLNKLSSKLKATMSLELIKYNIGSYLQNEYGPNCNNKYKYFYQLIQNLIYNRQTHLVSQFKDKMILDYIDEFLKRFYKKKESFGIIPQYSKFYANYQNYFCIPTFRIKCFYNQNFKEIDSHSKSENNIGIGAISMDSKFDKGKIYYKNVKENDETFFKKEVKQILEKESISKINMNSNTLSLYESGSKIKNNISHLLNNISNEESLCDIMNCLNEKKLFETKNSYKKNKGINIKKIYINSNSTNNNIKLVIKKRVINLKDNNNNTNNNYETSEFNKTKKQSILSKNIFKKVGTQSFKIFWNNKEYEKNFIIRKITKIHTKKEKKHIKSQDNLLTFHKNKKATRNLSYFSLYKKKSLPTNKSNSNISIKSKKIYMIMFKIR